ncbi:universal stress protein [Azohydromonas caseinilytica]|uniref:Universal stress protein n=1 Tax=Azohydromonas caseinilytica TaxID=2728836 RepID=A0A848FCB1_9BURK|nr:universal stress protein [Azohydromonas caseinilytica]NML17114.1 universal stress protein [Azohydromonas caseinilytica]
MKILLPVDGSDSTTKVLEYLATHEELFSKAHQYTVLYVTPAVPPQVKRMLPREDIEGYYQQEIEKVIAPIRAQLQERGFEVSFKGLVGRAPDVISQLATSEGYDMLIMGSHGHSALGNLILGSVVTNVMANTSTPVLVIR